MLGISNLTRAGVFRTGPGHFWRWTWWVGEGEDKKETASMGMTTWGAEGRVTALQFIYTITRSTGEKDSLDYQVEVVATACNFGGERYWFICPLVKGGCRCGRRVTKLPPEMLLAMARSGDLGHSLLALKAAMKVLDAGS